MSKVELAPLPRKVIETLQEHVIIGVRGDIGHGKDTFCRMLTDAFIDRGGLRLSRAIVPFAGALKAGLGVTLGLPDKSLYGTQEEKAEVLPEWGLSGRDLMRAFGTDAMRGVFGDSIWTRVWALHAYTLVTRIGGRHAFFIPDVRFKSEAAAVEEWGGRIVHIHRPGMPKTFMSDHQSDVDLADFEGDHYKVTNDSLVKLREAAVIILGMELRKKRTS